MKEHEWTCMTCGYHAKDPYAKDSEVMVDWHGYWHTKCMDFSKFPRPGKMMPDTLQTEA
jgi:hypothetical protein